MDKFAEIAHDGLAFSDELIEIEPSLNGAEFLPMEMNSKFAFSPAHEIDTAEELRIELDSLKAKMKPFLENYAPPVKPLRSRLPIKKAKWRIQTSDDEKDFSSVLQGLGNWDEVDLPHFGAPVGKAFTFYYCVFDELQSFDLPFLFLCFKGIDYKASVYWNGRFVGSHEGFFAPFEFQITPYVHVGKNVLIVAVENDTVQSQGGEKFYAATGLGFDDSKTGWHHCPPGMGIYQDMYLEARNEMAVTDIFVRPSQNLEDAECWVEVNGSHDMNEECKLSLSVYGQNFTETVFENLTYYPSTNLQVGMGDTLTEANVKANNRYNKPMPMPVRQGCNLYRIPFKIENARCWNNASPWLYQIQVKLTNSDGTLLDIQTRQFGMRTFCMDTMDTLKGRFELNGTPVKLRGANTMGHEQQCIYKNDFEQLIEDILLAKLCNMNFLRITQRPVQPELYDYCDCLGLMIQTDLPLFGVINRRQFCEGIRQAEEMERLIRSHPCCVIVTYINEPFPNAGNQPHRCVTRNELEDFITAAGIAVRLNNPDRVIKPIDGDYNPPEKTGLPDNHCYPCWYNAHGIDIGRLHKGYWMPTKSGWHHGCGEFGAEGLDPVDVMRRYYPKEWLPQTPEEEKSWSPSSIVNAQTGSFHYFFFKRPSSLAEWVKKSQRHQAWSTKIMTEAFRRDKLMNTFAIHLFIDAFPSGWMKAIMDVERTPKPAYFAYRNALSPLLVSLRTDRFSYFSGEIINLECYLCNDNSEIPVNAVLKYYAEYDKTVLCSGEKKAKISACSNDFQGNISISAPAISTRGVLQVYAALFTENGEFINQSVQDIKVLPKNNEQVNRNISVLSKTGDAAKLIKQLGMEVITKVSEKSVILIDSFDDYKMRCDELDLYVNTGGKLLFIDLPIGEHSIADSKVEVRPCPMLPVHFAAVNEQNTKMLEFEGMDFSHWYDEEIGYITPLADNVFVSDNFEPLLVGATASDSNHWGTALIAGEKSFGKGTISIALIKLTDRVRTNPTARDFIRKLLE